MKQQEPIHMECDSWERVLWKKQKYPDNYVGKSFFRVHTKCHKVTYGQAVYGSVFLAQEISSCAGLVAVFWGVSEKEVRTVTVLAFASVFTIIGYLIYRIPCLIKRKESCKEISLLSFMDEVKILVFTVLLIWFVSPIIQTLTASVATDTIHACTTGLLSLHLALHYYGADVALVNPTMSHNLGLFASVCLASRLNCSMDVFALMIVAVIFFNLLPSFRNFCQESLSANSIFLLTTILFTGSLVGLFMFAPSLCVLFIVIIFFVIGVAPVMFIYLQPYRQNIYGPWDEALLVDEDL